MRLRKDIFYPKIQIISKKNYRIGMDKFKFIIICYGIKVNPRTPIFANNELKRIFVFF